MNKNIIRYKKLIEKYQQAIIEEQKTCEHNEELIKNSYSDGWNGYDYPATTRGSSDYKCTKCGVLIIKYFYVAHGYLLSEKDRQFKETSVIYG